jgi:glycosyltransferase involved in cell wall biosynthesis
MVERKVLTVTVPAYNAAGTIRRCLDTFLEPRVLPLLDVIIVDDGSRDATGAIADEYARLYPGSFRVVHKENGGHGSGINVAIKLARGRYFKALDADDTLSVANLTAFIAALASANADVVVSPFSTVSPRGQVLRKFPLAGVISGREYGLADFWESAGNMKPCCSFHGLCYRTDFYRACGVKLSERIFYDDGEYATLPFRDVQTVLPLDFPLYEYTLGTVEQSVSSSNYVRNLPHLEQVFWVIWEAYRTLPAERDLHNSAVRAYFRYKMAEIFLDYCTAALLKATDRRAGREQVRLFWRRLREQDREFSRYTAKRYFIVLALYYTGFRSSRWEALRQLPCYSYLRRLAS